MYTDEGDNYTEEQCSYCPSSTHLRHIQSQLYSIYSSSQNYYYTKELNEIIDEALTQANIRFQDDQYYDDYEEFLKRQYLIDEFPNKIYNIHQYYYYHKDAPRLYLSHIAKPYNKWQDRKKSFLYRKLKKMLKEPESRTESANYENEQQEVMDPASHVLMDISDYNPYSKNYYLRKRVKKVHLQPTQTTRSICDQLKKMLNSFSDMSSLSIVTAIDSPKNVSPPAQARTTRLDEPYKPPKDLNTITKFNFKKKKITIEPVPLTERDGRHTVFARYSSESKPLLLAFRKSEQQIIINHPETRRSIPTISLQTKKLDHRQQKLRSESLKNVRIRQFKTPADQAASLTRLTLKKPEQVKKINKKDSTRQFCDDKIMEKRVQSYQSQQILPTKTTVGKALLIPTMSTAFASLQTTRKFDNQNRRISINDETINRILRMRYDGK